MSELNNLLSSMRPDGPIPMNEGDKQSIEGMQQQMAQRTLAARVLADFSEAESSRYDAENQWLKNLRAYRAEDLSLIHI